MLKEIRDANNIIIDLIKIYDNKFSQLYNHTIATIGISFVITTFIMNVYATLGFTFENINIFYVIVVAFFFAVTLYYLLNSLKKCSKGIESRIISTTDSDEFIKECQTYNEDKLLDFLIVQLSDYYKDNFDTYKTMKNDYIAAIGNLKNAINGLTIFIIVSIIILYISGL